MVHSTQYSNMAKPGNKVSDSGIASTLRDATMRAIRWLLGQQRGDGSVSDAEEGVDAYYKLPYALGAAGRSGEAHRLLDWIRVSQMTPNGDFRGSRQRSRVTFHSSWPTYANSWIVIGAHRLGRFDISEKGINYILSYQETCGGFRSRALSDEAEVLEPVCTAWGGLAALYLGRVERARKAGDCLVSMIRQQTDRRRFYYRMALDGKLIRNAPDGQNLFYCVDASQEGQIYYNLGIAMIFLGLLHGATSQPSYLDGCQQILAFTRRCSPDVYESFPSGKLGMGCAVLFSATGNEEARRAALHVAGYLVKTQQPEGFWRLPNDALYRDITGKDSLDVTIDITAEFTVFLTETLARCFH